MSLHNPKTLPGVCDSYTRGDLDGMLVWEGRVVGNYVSRTQAEAIGLRDFWISAIDADRFS